MQLIYPLQLLHVIQLIHIIQLMQLHLIYILLRIYTIQGMYITKLIYIIKLMYIMPQIYIIIRYILYSCYLPLLSVQDLVPDWGAKQHLVPEELYGLQAAHHHPRICRNYQYFQTENRFIVLYIVSEHSWKNFINLPAHNQAHLVLNSFLCFPHEILPLAFVHLYAHPL